MTRSGQRWVGALVASLAVATTLADPAAGQVRYLKMLELPDREDSIRYPNAVTADLHTGEVFVCDGHANRVLIFDREGLFSYELSGGNTFSGPKDIAVDPEGFLLLLARHELRLTVLELDFDGLFIRKIGLQGLPDWAVEPRLVSLALSDDGGRLYLLDRDNMRVWISDRDGQVSGSIDLGVDLTEEQKRDGLLGHVDVSSDRVLVALPRVGKVRAFDLEGNLVSTTGAAGTGECELLFPVAAAIDSDENLLVVDMHRMVFATWSIETNRCLEDHYGFGLAPGYLYFPTDLALDDLGRVYVAQAFEGRVQVYEGAAPAVRSSTRAGSGPPTLEP